MKYYSIGEFAKEIGKTIQTLRNWDKKNILTPSHVTQGGTRYYSQEQLNHFLGLKWEKQIKKKIVVLYKDRLIRFGNELIENLCNKFGTTIEIIDNTEKTEQQELVEDLVQIVTVFSCSLQGKRANKAKKMIKELIEDDKDIKDNADSK